ncbi:hypothetical protein [Streptomyces pseudovenezuelae]|uniref:Uncharacterized protein n=1 Tax=Streptomyces pseudovenezuelae TaxID=67350 RepID=A0ABT6LCW7_9ACTN|nr:hypothetical protein [Streptomyces pseudovenezuelae]MDH6214155.1 hypothetical protein [Streptomyces pseudovenezuelae]
MTHIKPGRIFAACDPRDDIRIRIEQYKPGDMRALVVDAVTGQRRRLMLVSALHASAFTNAGVPRRSGYAPDATELATPKVVPPVGVPGEEEPDWFEGMPGRQFRVALPPRLTLLNANQRLHHHKRAEITRVLRRAAWAASRTVPPLERVHIIGVLHPEDRQRRDPANWYPSFKACVDGLVDQGVLADDDHTRVVGPDMRMGHMVEGARLVLHIRDLTFADIATDLRK